MASSVTGRNRRCGQSVHLIRGFRTALEPTRWRKRLIATLARFPTLEAARIDVFASRKSARNRAILHSGGTDDGQDQLAVPSEPPWRRKGTQLFLDKRTSAPRKRSEKSCVHLLQEMVTWRSERRQTSRF